MTYLPIVDISRHQGAANLSVCKAKGVAGLIFRASHGTVADDRFALYWRQALDVGYTRDDLTVYTFINPKRGTGRDTAGATLEIVANVVGDTEVGYMLDVESYRMEPPNAGKSPVAGAAFADYLREHIAVVEAAGARVFAYSNRAYWNGAEGPNDDALAAELEWLVPRYPAYSAAAYARWPLPADPAGWDEWAFARAAGPTPPRGARWLGWQFSAGFNRQGAPYGFQSSDLDLNIVDADAWVRWAARPTLIEVPDIITPEVPDVFIYRINGYANAWLIGAGPATHLDGPSVEHLTGKSVPIVTAPKHAQTLRCILHQSGLTEADLVAL